MSKICIDPGHGGTDPGAVGFGRKEKDDVLKIALKIKALLENQDAEVILTRSTDKDVTINERTALANKEKCDYFLSIHRDAFSDASANGASIYVYSQASTDTVNKAKSIYLAAVEASGFNARGLKKGAAGYSDYGVNKYSNMPSALLELGFITNKADNSLFDSKIDAIASAIAKGLCNITGVSYAGKTVAAAKTEKASDNGTSYPTLQRGSNGNYVKILQAELNAAGFACGEVDGDFGSKTNTALRIYQQKKGLGVDGICGPKTWTKINASAHQTVRSGSKGNYVEVLQARLNAAGYSCGKIDGDFGSKTVYAVKAYQKKTGLDDDGICGPLTWASLI